ncbi:oxidoreductase-like domain-containing protein [Propionivibrio sp.]|uniref:oxidoreductase-like domain-containing protein n=2 Tax=Propionivibrio sp. TaxID=2212460 RepID=UPI00343FC22B
MILDTHESPDPFNLPMNDLADCQTLVSEIEALLAARRLSMRQPPPVPNTCCGRGCNGCVWQGYFEALSYWRDQASELLR